MSVRGLSIQRHDHIVIAIAHWVHELGCTTYLEQYVPEWQTDEARARLDLSYLDPRRGHIHVDVSVVAAATHTGVAVATRTRRREKDKHKRYDGPRLIPFALDPRGAWGKEAISWAREFEQTA